MRSRRWCGTESRPSKSLSRQHPLVYDGQATLTICPTPSIAFRHLPPNSVRFSYATEGALFISAQLSTDAVSALRKVWVLIKPVLNWANVCSPNILRTVRRTMICFLLELLVRRTWFGQFEEFTCSQLACSEMQASARTCGRRAADSTIENVG